MGRTDCSIHPKFIGINGVRTGESVAESVSALAAATGKDLAAVSGSHSLSEAMNFLAMELLGLIGTFRCHVETPPVRFPSALRRHLLDTAGIRRRSKQFSAPAYDAPNSIQTFLLSVKNKL